MSTPFYCQRFFSDRQTYLFYLLLLASRWPDAEVPAL